MQQVYVTRTLADVYLVRDYLAAEGVPTEIRNEHLFGAQGDVPVTSDSLPSLWADDDLVARARELIESHRAEGDEEGVAALAAMDTDASPHAQAAMSELFVAADRLTRGGNGAQIDQVQRNGDIVARSSAPFGIDPTLWQRLATLARDIVHAAEHDDVAGVTAAAGELRDLLRDLV